MPLVAQTASNAQIDAQATIATRLIPEYRAIEKAARRRPVAALHVAHAVACGMPRLTTFTGSSKSAFFFSGNAGDRGIDDGLGSFDQILNCLRLALLGWIKVSVETAAYPVCSIEQIACITECLFRRYAS